MNGPVASQEPEVHHHAPGRLLLTLQAIRIAWHAQRAVRSPLPLAIRQLNRLRHLPRAARLSDALIATRRAARVLAMLGRDSQCLNDALVLSTLLSDRPDVHIRLGFRDKAASGIVDVDGHAWITVANQRVLHRPDHLGEYVESSCYPVRRTNA